MLNKYGINLENKRALIEGRLSNIVLQSEHQDFHDYVEYILNEPSQEHLSTMVSKLTTNYTFFMREPQHYSFMRSTALPEWAEKIKDGELRIWSAGCSSGEEAYSVAIATDQFFKQTQRLLNLKIRATDISSNVLKQAREGIYPLDHVENLGKEVMEKYFHKLSDGRYQVSGPLMRSVQFEKLNLMDEFKKPIRRFHIIFCRNVMIYFKTDTKEKLSEKLYDMLEPGGYFFIGLSETLSNVKTRFEYVAPAIYKKVKD